MLCTVILETKVHVILKFMSSYATLPTKVCIVKATLFPVIIYGYESWTIKKAERHISKYFMLRFVFVIFYIVHYWYIEMQLIFVCCLCILQLDWIHLLVLTSVFAGGFLGFSSIRMLSVRSILMVQGLGLWAFTAKGSGSIPGWGTKIPQAVWYGKTKNCYLQIEISLLLLFQFGYL